MAGTFFGRERLSMPKVCAALLEEFRLSLVPPGEARAGERTAVLRRLPLSPTLSPLVPRGERETGAFLHLVNCV